MAGSHHFALQLYGNGPATQFAANSDQTAWQFERSTTRMMQSVRATHCATRTAISLTGNNNGGMLMGQANVSIGTHSFEIKYNCSAPNIKPSRTSISVRDSSGALCGEYSGMRSQMTVSDGQNANVIVGLLMAIEVMAMP